MDESIEDTDTEIWVLAHNKTRDKLFPWYTELTHRASPIDNILFPTIKENVISAWKAVSVSVNMGSYSYKLDVDRLECAIQNYSNDIMRAENEVRTVGRRMADYRASLSYPHWSSLRWEMIVKHNNRCQKCGEGDVLLELHHLHYETLGHETPTDVMLLCKPCHNEEDIKEKATR